MPIPTDLATLPAGVGAKVAVKVGGKIMYALPDAAVPAAIGAANRATEIVSTGYGLQLEEQRMRLALHLEIKRRLNRDWTLLLGGSIRHLA